MVDVNNPPNPPNSPLEKLVTSYRLPAVFDLGQYLVKEGVDPELASKISKGVSNWENDKLYTHMQELKELETWANMHTHPGVSGGDSGVELFGAAWLLRVNRPALLGTNGVYRLYERTGTDFADLSGTGSSSDRLPIRFFAGVMHGGTADSSHTTHYRSQEDLTAVWNSDGGANRWWWADQNEEFILFCGGQEYYVQDTVFGITNLGTFSSSSAKNLTFWYPGNRRWYTHSNATNLFKSITEDPNDGIESSGISSPSNPTIGGFTNDFAIILSRTGSAARIHSTKDKAASWVNQDVDYTAAWGGSIFSDYLNHLESSPDILVLNQAVTVDGSNHPPIVIYDVDPLNWGYAVWSDTGDPIDGKTTRARYDGTSEWRMFCLDSPTVGEACVLTSPDGISWSVHSLVSIEDPKLHTIELDYPRNPPVWFIE